VIISGESSYTLMAFRARLPGWWPALGLAGDVRVAHVLSTLAISAGLIVVALNLGPVMTAGADLADAGQRLYAANLWQEVQVSLAAIAVFLPWLLYGLLWRGAPWGSRILIVVAAAGTLVGTAITMVGVESYAALPRSVTGVISRIDGRTLWLQSPPAGYYLVVSDSQLARSRASLRAGSAVTLWVSPRGQVGDVEPSP
jgi:hypothetical protein